MNVEEIKVAEFSVEEDGIDTESCPICENKFTIEETEYSDEYIYQHFTCNICEVHGKRVIPYNIIGIDIELNDRTYYKYCDMIAHVQAIELQDVNMELLRKLIDKYFENLK